MHTIDFHGLPITIYVNNIESDIMQMVNNRERKSFTGYSMPSLYMFINLMNYYKISLVNDYFLCDGRGFYFFLKMLKIKGLSTMSLPDLTFELLSIAKKHDLSIYALGAQNNVNLLAQRNLKEKYGLNFVYGHHGYFNIDEESTIVDDINKYQPNILLLGMSSPKKEEFLYRWKQNISANVTVLCGGMLDVIAGEKKMYPPIVKRLCLAWLFRFLQEPVRLRRDFLNIFPSAFIMMKLLISIKLMRKNANIANLIKK